MYYESVEGNGKDRCVHDVQFDAAREEWYCAICWEIIAELAPAPGEPILDKPSYGPFATTDIDAVLRGRGVRNLVLTGVTTDCCVTSCLREALDRGYDCLVLADCVGSANPVHHEAALTLMHKRSGVFGTTATADAFVAAIDNQG